YSQDILGLIKVKYENLPESYKLYPLPDTIQLFDEIVSDSLFIWYQQTSVDSLDMVIKYNDESDTLKYKKPRDTFKGKKLTFNNPRENRKNFHRTDSLFIEMNRPLVSLDTSHIILKDSSDRTVPFASGIKGRSFWIYTSFKNDVSYTVMLHPDAMTDWYGNALADSLIISCQTFDSEKFGSINVAVSGIMDTIYILELMDKDKSIDTRILKNNDIIVFNKLKSSTYSFKITEDLNGDGRWTAGTLLGKIKSERTREVQIESLKEGWELELDVDINELFDGTEN
ncbi:MAG: hypothetical protein KJO50_05260, partial [Bacteroidia bacterium]|nr:hypothetical protein [Bacteroidia bacterium]